MALCKCLYSPVSWVCHGRLDPWRRFVCFKLSRNGNNSSTTFLFFSSTLKTAPLSYTRDPLASINYMNSFILKISAAISGPLVPLWWALSSRFIRVSLLHPPIISLFATSREYSSFLLLFFSVCFRELEPSAPTCKFVRRCWLNHFVLATKPLMIWDGISLDHNEFHGHHAVAMNHSYPAYVAPGPASTPRTSDNSNNPDDHPWNSHSSDHFHQLSVAPHYHHHHHHSTSFSLPGAHVIDGEIDSSAARGISHPHPFLFGYRLDSRAQYNIFPTFAASLRMFFLCWIWAMQV